MDTSTHFNLNLVTGSDKVNPLTVDRPNYETIDEQMYKNQIAAISEATELKSGTSHAITCLTENAVFFRFTATSNFAAGDTFTYNGTPVSAVLPDGSGLQTGAFKINSTVLCSIIGTLLTVYSYTASGIAADAEKLGGQLPAYYAKATDAISTYIHSRIGTVNNFVGNGANGKVKIAADIQPGDTIQINGQPVTAFAGVEDFVEALADKNLVGKTLFFLYDSGSQTVNFNIAGGAKAALAGNFGFWCVRQGEFAGTYNSNFYNVEQTSEYVGIKSNSPFTITVEPGDYFVNMAAISNGDTATNMIAKLVDTNGDSVFEATTGYLNAGYGIPTKIRLSGDYFPQVNRPDENTAFGYITLIKA